MGDLPRTTYRAKKYTRFRVGQSGSTYILQTEHLAPRHVPVALHRHHHSGNAEGGEAVGRGVFFLKKERNAMLNFLFAHSVHFIESLHEHGRNKSEIIGRTPTFFHRIYILTTFIL
jgi:hypothetical protein